MKEFTKLFEPGSVGRVQVANRIVMAGMHTCLGTPDGNITDHQLKYYARRSRGGAGLIVTEAVSVHPTGSVPFVPGAYDDRFVDGLAKLASAIKDGGARAYCQIWHPGKAVSSKATGFPIVAPSAVAGRPNFEMPEPARVELIQEIIESHVAAAVRAARAGFDGVELHCGHGYFICSFMSRRTNLRDDEFGGDLAHRTRVATDILRGIRKQLGADFSVICRISGQEGPTGGIEPEEAAAIARVLEEAGADAISVSAGCPDAWDLTCPPMHMPQACYAPFAATVRAAVTVPVMVAGRINDPAVAEAVLQDGAADFVAVGRGLLADPDFPKKAQAGRADDIRRCVGCGTCTDAGIKGLSVRCILNPELGNEGSFSMTRAARRKRVVVVGGGPGGMQAAAILAQRGHQVDLYERDEALGGKLPLCAAPEWKRGFQALTDYLARQLVRNGVQVKIGKTATATMLEREAPDVVVLATGAEAVVPEIPGLAALLKSGRAVMADDVLLGHKSVGHKVFVMGGSYTACELALVLARRGHEVTMARRGKRIGGEMGRAARWTILPELEQRGATMLSGVTYEHAGEDGVVISRDGEQQTIVADTLIVAAGYQPRHDFGDALSQTGIVVHAIGDCVQPGNLYDAMHDAARIAAQI